VVINLKTAKALGLAEGEFDRSQSHGQRVVKQDVDNPMESVLN
jgi:hypothetical protein